MRRRSVQLSCSVRSARSGCGGGLAACAEAARGTSGSRRRAPHRTPRPRLLALWERRAAAVADAYPPPLAPTCATLRCTRKCCVP
ncbi:hypothetical protein FA09DRAFT_148351 [Tilletiopsis washingtonensis]|uniref:Uncharacterized protein n=1 Tax=Tilletiopsis washingtonensis TaxID=58919 RepID=A0A316Z1D6_9BASI|nr:hypothetical protein FA09DRAFT_148351 [Tilletiopsis washingtonensis]PWN95351.1 hypothetical protein FA09DRAFT_148351 [Tilletiopsis washingtonensis]